MTGAETSEEGRWPPVGSVVRGEGRRRRPSGEPPPLPHPPWWPWAVVLLLSVMVVGAILGLIYAGSPPEGTLRWWADLRTDWLVDLSRVLNRFATSTGIVVLRVAMAIVLVRYGRLRHLVVAIVAMWFVDVAVTLLRFDLPAPAVDVIVRPTNGQYFFPAGAIASLSVTFGVMVMSLAPSGRQRWIAGVSAAAFAIVVVLARAVLGTTYPLAGLYSVLLGFAVAVVAFGWLAPEASFPVSYRRGGTGAHLDLAGSRTTAVIDAMRDQLGIEVTAVRSFGEEGSGGSTPLLMIREGGGHVFGKILANSHVRSDRWYRIVRTIMYGRLEDETSFSSVRKLIAYEDYALRLLEDDGFRVAHSYGIVELTPNEEYLLAQEFFENAQTLGHAEVTDDVVDEGMQLVRRLWDAGLAHRDIKPANLLVVEGHLQLIDVSGLEIRPSPWRQAVDLANMMLVMALRSDAERVYRCALSYFTPEDVGEAFAAAKGMAIPTELQRYLKNDPRDLVGEFRALAPPHPPVSIQRWSARRVGLTLMVVVGSAVLAAWSFTIFFTVAD